MKVLLAHNHYRSAAPSGEDAVFRNEWRLLRQNGIEVVAYERFNDEIPEEHWSAQAGVALASAWSRATYRELSRLIRRTRPDVAHFHNTFPLVSPSAWAACRDQGVAVVQTLHNYRLVCAGGLLTRDGRPCEECLEGSMLPALRHRCYRASLAATGAVVWMLVSNRLRGSYRELVDRYIALTGFAADRLAAGGLPRERIEIKPNFIEHTRAPARKRAAYAVYVGRLSAEKGVRTLLQAWKSVEGLALKIVGDGPLRDELERQARRDGLDAQFLGRLAPEAVLDVVGRAYLQVVPSEWYEGFPMVVVEAYACGTPVVASRIGSLDEIVDEGQTGMKFRAGDAADLAKVVNALRRLPALLEAMRGQAHRMFRERYSPERNFAQLMAIYQRALARRNAGRGADARRA